MMKLFAAYTGNWNPRYNGFKSQKLEFAGGPLQLDLANTHHAVDDARLTAGCCCGILLRVKQLGLSAANAQNQGDCFTAFAMASQ
jgi:hypothetical protein